MPLGLFPRGPFEQRKSVVQEISLSLKAAKFPEILQFIHRVSLYLNLKPSCFRHGIYLQ